MGHGLFITEGGHHYEIPRVHVIVTFLLSKDSAPRSL